MATVERGGSRETDQPTMSLTFWQSVLVRARPYPRSSYSLFPCVPTMGACATRACWFLSSKVNSESMRVQNKKSKLENLNASDV